jgi:hypothetical protein
MLNCPHCGLTNRPYDSDCTLCRKPIQDVDAADARRREWDALPAALREEQEKAFDRMRAGTEGHRLWLKRHRLTHSIIGAALVNMLMNGSVFFASPWSIPVDLAIGAAAAFQLNRMRGGSWAGAGLFVAAALLSVLLRAPFLNMELYLNGYWFFTCFAVFLLSIAGYFMGMKLDYEHLDHSVTG